MSEMKNYPENEEQPIVNVLNEAAALYTVRSSTKSFSAKLSSATVFDDKMMLVNLIRAGIPFVVFNKIKDVTPFNDDDWSSYLNLSKKSLQRYSAETNFTFKPIHSEKILELAEVTTLGQQVFDSPKQFKAWLNTPSFVFNQLKPVHLLKDSYGKELVMDELHRIDNGVFA